MNTVTYMDKIEITRVSLTEIKELQEISKKTFIETFAHENTEDDMRKYLEVNLSANKLKGELLDANSEFYFASLNKKAVGYLKVNSGQAQTEIKESISLEIERIYVLKEYQGKKIGQILFDTAMKIAMNLKAEFIWLGVWEKNTRAMNFYLKIGFKEFGKHLFILGNDEQTDIMMKLNLNPATPG